MFLCLFDPTHDFFPSNRGQKTLSLWIHDLYLEHEHEGLRESTIDDANAANLSLRV